MEVIHKQTQQIAGINMAISETQISTKRQKELFKSNQRRGKLNLKLIASTSQGSPVGCILLQHFVTSPQCHLLIELPEPSNRCLFKLGSTTCLIPFKRRLQHKIVVPPVEKYLIHVGFLLSLLNFKLTATLESTCHSLNNQRRH